MRRQSLPAPFSARAFSTREALAAGVPPTRLRASDLRAPHRGVRVVGEPQSLLDRCRELAPLLAPDEYFAHVTALGLFGVPLPWRAPAAALHVGRPSGAPGRQRRRPGVIGHKLAPADLLDLDGLSVVSPVDAWLQSAAHLRLDDLVQLGDSLVGSWAEASEVAQGLPLDQLEDAVDTAKGRPGVALLREAITLVRPGVESPKETALRLLLVRAGLPEPEINVERFGADGSYLGKPDLSYSWCKVALEYEGDEHRRDRERWQRDITRRERFEHHGWRVVRVTERDLHPPYDRRLLDRVARLVNTAAPR
ncbi:hypothetical protein ACPEEZ_09580 [Frigoribacterium sp. 2-23]|uniref:hypothetical protein n=1 Tax=Frigoribacterium sp. 2-23 TaxID=3415006 RepID=UPI003C6F7EB7